MKVKTRNTIIVFFCVIVIILIVIGVPIAINNVYLSGFKNNIQVNTMYTAGDLLIYLGAILAASGSTYLGYMAYSLNKKIIKSTELEAENRKISIVIVEPRTDADSNWPVFPDGYDSICDQVSKNGVETLGNIYFRLINTGPAVLKNLKVYYFNKLNGLNMCFSQQCTLAQDSKLHLRVPFIKGCSSDSFFFEFVLPHWTDFLVAAPVAKRGHIRLKFFRFNGGNNFQEKFICIFELF